MGAVDCPSLLLPQQVIVLSIFMPQECIHPALTWMKRPEGGEDCPKKLSPQQAIVLSALMPQVCNSPTLI